MEETNTVNATQQESSTTQGSVSATRLKNFIERIERLEEEKNNIMEDIREVYKEASANGFDVSTMKKIVKLRKIDIKKLEEQEYLLDLYRNALGI